MTINKKQSAIRRPGRRRPNKYGAIPSGGYHSKKEHRRACELKMLERGGVISNLQEQVRYELIPEQKANNGETFRALHYIADFVYNDASGSLVVEDVKGVRTPVYRIKKKLMLLVHGITIHEV